MADRVVESSDLEVPEIPEILDKVLVFSLEEAKEKMQKGEELVPFTSLVVKDNLFLESHPGSNSKKCYDDACHTVEHARGASAYAFCYDGYIEIDDGKRDAIIAEGGVPGADVGVAAAYLYEKDKKEKTYTFGEQPVYIGEAPNFMIALREAEEYAEEEIEERYRDDEDDESEDEQTFGDEQEFEDNDESDDEQEPEGEDTAALDGDDE